MADLVSRLAIDDSQFKQNLDAAAAAVETTTARMNRAVATIDRTGQRFDAVESGIKKVNRALGDATGALTLFGSGGLQVAQRLAPVSGALSTVADAAGALTNLFRGGAAGLGLSSIVPVLGAVVTAATGLYGIYRLLAPATEQAASSEKDYEEALKFTEDRLKTAEERTRALTEAKERQVGVTIRSRQEILAEALAQRQADLAFAQSAAAEAARQAQNPARRGTLRQGVAGQAVQGSNQVEREITADIERLNRELERANAGLTRLAAPVSSGAATGLRNAAAAAQVLEQALARLRAGPAGQTYAAGLNQIGEAAQQAGAIIESNLTPYQRYVQELERIGTASETILARQGQVEGEATIRRATEGALQRLREQESQTNRASNAARELGLTFSSAFEDAVVGGKKLSDVLKGLASDLARLVVRRTITEPLANAASSALNSIGGSLFGTGSASGSGGGGSSLVANESSGGTLLERLLGVNFGFGGARAMGGPVAGGTAYLVGERGPELFVPGSSGAIIPNEGFGGGNVSFSSNVTVDARGSSIGPVELRAAVLAGIAESERRFRDSLRRDPSMRALAQGRA